LDLAYAVSNSGDWGAVRSHVPASYRTTTLYYVFIQLQLSERKDLVLGVMDTKCTCLNAARKLCTHVAAVMITIQDMVYSSFCSPHRNGRKCGGMWIHCPVRGGPYNLRCIY
jgi:hypothetical protein